MSRKLGDPARRSDVNSKPGVAELALSLGNWAIRLAEVVYILGQMSRDWPCLSQTGRPGSEGQEDGGRQTSRAE